jgi:ankyrin repeat protein
MKAARRNDIAMIHRLLAQESGGKKLTPDTANDRVPDVDLSEVDADGYTALHHAAYKGSDRALLALLQHGARTELQTSSGATALMLAAQKGRSVAVEILLMHQAVPSSSDSDSSTFTLVEKHNLHRYELAARRYRDMAETERQEALCNAVSKGDLDTAARMVAAKGMDIESVDQRDTTLLGYAVRSGNETMVRLLLCAGAKVNGKDPASTSPLMHAVLSQQLAIIPVLRHAGASTIQERIDGESALTLAIRVDSVPIMHALIGNEAGFLTDGKRGETLLTLAIEVKSSNIARELLTLGADLPNKARAGSCALAIFAKKGDQTGVRFLLAAGTDPNHKAFDGHTAFTLAAANGHLGVVHTLLSHCKQSAGPRAHKAMLQLLNQTDTKGRTALMLATLNGHTETVEFLLKQGADIHGCDINGMNALLWAVAKANSEMVNLLFNHHAAHVLFDHLGNSGIMIAAAHGNLITLKVLLTPAYANSLYNLNTPNKKKETALTIAAANGNEAIVRELLQAKANVLHVNAAGRSAKLEAVAHGHVAIVKLLESAEQVLLKSARSTKGILAVLAKIPVFGPLLPDISSIKVPQVDKEGNSALALAARYGHADMVTNLVSAANANPAFSLAISMGSETQSIEHGNDTDNLADGLVNGWQKLSGANTVDIEQQNRKGMTPLCLAVANGREDIVRLLVECDALVNHASHNLRTPLWLAASMPAYQPAAASGTDPDLASADGEAMIRLLLEKRADVNMPSVCGETPLHAAAASGRLTTVETLLHHKAGIDVYDQYGRSPLGQAAVNGHAELVQYLLGKGVKPNAAQGSHAPLTMAASNGHDAVVTLLAQRGATVDHADADGRTALIVAAKRGKTTTVALLLALGANLHQQCRQGYTALEHASQAGHKDIVALLQNGHPPPRDN